MNTDRSSTRFITRANTLANSMAEEVLDPAHGGSTRKNILDGQIYLIRNVLSQAECHRLIESARSIGFQRAGLAVGDDEYLLRLNTRNNSRVILDDQAFADRLWTRVSAQVLPVIGQIGRHRAIGLNGRFRVYRYAQGERFAPHVDRSFLREQDNARTLFSFMIYLNENFEGGETTFFERRGKGRGRGGADRIKKRVQPQTGAALAFDHALFHEGSLVERGAKYAVRSDIFYSA